MNKLLLVLLMMLVSSPVYAKSYARRFPSDTSLEVATPADLPFKGVSSAAPSNPDEGDTYIDSDDDKLYIYYGGTWQELHTLTPAAVVNRTIVGGGDRTLIGGATRTII